MQPNRRNQRRTLTDRPFSVLVGGVPNHDNRAVEMIIIVILHTHARLRQWIVIVTLLIISIRIACCTLLLLLFNDYHRHRHHHNYRYVQARVVFHTVRSTRGRRRVVNTDGIILFRVKVRWSS